MFLWSIQIILFSFLFIFLIHHLFLFFKNTLTTPKVKDLVNIHTEKYNAIYDVINNQERKEPTLYENLDISSLLPVNKNPPSMKDELKFFLKKQMQSSDNIIDLNSSTSIDLLDSKIGFSTLS
jgi:hypothetical protein